MEQDRHHSVPCELFYESLCKSGFISDNGRIQVHKSLLNVVLLDQLPDHNAQKPAILPIV